MNSYHKLKIKEGKECFLRIQNAAQMDIERKSHTASLELKYWFVEFGKEHKFFSHISYVGGAYYTVTLSEKGYEIIETKNGFEKFYKRNVVRKQKVGDYQYYSVKFWWLPIIISLIAVLISILN